MSTTHQILLQHTACFPYLLVASAYLHTLKISDKPHRSPICLWQQALWLQANA